MSSPFFTLARTVRGITLALGCALFPAIAPLDAFAADRTVRLVVTVKEDDGSVPIAGAHVNVYQANRTGSDWIARPPDYQQDTNVQGVARFEINLKRGEPLKLSIEASREDKIAQRDDVDLGKDVPPQVLRQFFLKPRIAEGSAEGTTATVKVIVKRKDNQQAVDKATVEVTSIGGIAGQRNSAQTNGSGEASIVMPRSPAFDVAVTKELFGGASQRVTAKDKQTEVGPVELLLERQRGTEVSFTVTDDRNNQPVGDARVILDGPQYVRTSTDAGGKATLTVPEAGSYALRVQQQYYEKYEDQVTIGAGEETKNVDVSLTAKDKADAEKDVIEATVLGRDPSDKDSNPVPLRGAEIKVGRFSAGTDETGHARLTGSYNIREEVTASAKGYKPQTKTVGLNKLMRYAAGKGTATFILEPQISEADPVKLVVVVRDTADRVVPQAGVDFLQADGTWVWGAAANAKGERDFVSADIPNLDSSTLRRGMKVQVKKTGYKDHESLVSSDLLQPGTQPRRYLVQLEKDWTELTQAITSLEQRIAFWKSDAQSIQTKAKSVDALSAKCAAAQGRAEALLTELKAAQKSSDTTKSEEGCKEARELAKKIEGLKGEASQKETAIRSALDEATSVAATCKSKAEADSIRSKHRSAIVLTGELGTLEKQARLANQRLSTLAQGGTDAGPPKQAQEIVDKIESELSAVGKDAASADNDFDAAISSGKALPGRRQSLLEALDELRLKYHVREDEQILPPDIRRRLDNFEAVLRTGGNDMSMSFVPSIDRSRLNVIKETVSRVQEYKNQAASIVAGLKKGACDVRPLDEAVQEIGAAVVGASIELGAAGDLVSKAQACDAAVAAASPSPSSTPDDEVTVPDVSVFADVGQMKAAAAGAGLVPALVATKATPPANSTRLFASQDPPAGSKTKRGKPLRIVLYQQVAQASPTPSPSPTPVAKASPSPTESDEVRVPDLSIFDGLVEMKAAASQVGLIPALAATKATPPPNSTRLFAGQDPPAGSKAKRGSSLKILVYQKTAETAAATPTPTATPSPTAIAVSGNMPNLIGLTLDQAVTRLTSNMRIGSDEIGDKPPTAEKALTIFSQSPAAGSRVDTSRPIVISVKRYGSAQTQAATAQRFDGTYVGSYSGADSGRVRFTVSGGTISISSPGSGSGRVSAGGSASISGAGTDSSSSYSFSGTFSISADGKASASGRWTGKQQGYSGSGTWRASRP